MIQTPQVELHHFEQRDIDNLESGETSTFLCVHFGDIILLLSVDTQLKVETSIRNSNSSSDISINVYVYRCCLYSYHVCVN